MKAERKLHIPGRQRKKHQSRPTTIHPALLRFARISDAAMCKCGPTERLPPGYFFAYTAEI